MRGWRAGEGRGGARWASPAGLRWAVVVWAAAWAGCSTPAPNSLPSDPGLQGRDSGVARAPFSGERVVRDAEELVALGSRSPGSDSAKRAAQWLGQRLGEIGATVEVWPGAEPAGAPEGRERPASNRAIVGVLDGEGQDPVLLLARYDTLPGERDGAGPGDFSAAAGAAMVLELGRVLAEGARPFPIWLVLIEGDGAAARGRASGPSTSSDLAARFPGSQALATELIERDLIGQIRLAIYLGALPGPRLVVARDLRSHRMYRESFWHSAEKSGEVQLFPIAAEFSSPQQGHLALLAEGLRPTVALVGELSEGGAGAPGPLPASAADFQSLGRVTLDTLHEITDRLRRLEAFADSPSRGSGGESSRAPAASPESGSGGAFRAP